jgi:hypothetical protein
MIQLMESEIKNERFLLNSENFSYRNLFTIANSCFHQAIPSIRATAFMSNIVWRLEKVRSFFSGSTPLITQETARAAQQQNFFSNKKIREAIQFNFIPIEQSIRDTCAILKGEV